MRLSTAAFLVVLFVAPLLGHHAVGANFDASKVTTIQGTITKVEWNNPHVWIDMNATGPGGAVNVWRIQIAAIGALGRAGIDKSMFDLSKSFSIVVWPAFDGSRHANGRTLTLSDGRIFDVSDKWPEAR